MKVESKNCRKKVDGRKGKIFCCLYCKSAFQYEKDKNKAPTRFQIVDRQLKLNVRVHLAP